jgi:hypothetical protein
LISSRREQVALDEFLRLTPGKNPWTVGTKPQRRHDEVIKVEREVANLEREIGTLVAHVTREGALRDVENLRTKTAEIEKLNAAVARRLKESGKAFEAFILEQWNPLAELLEQRATLRTEVAQAGTLRSVQMLDPEAASRWEEVSVAPETPRTGAPPDAGAFTSMLIDVTLDPGNDGYRAEPTIVETHFAPATCGRFPASRGTRGRSSKRATANTRPGSPSCCPTCAARTLASKRATGSGSVSSASTRGRGSSRLGRSERARLRPADREPNGPRYRRARSTTQRSRPASPLPGARRAAAQRATPSAAGSFNCGCGSR